MELRIPKLALRKTKVEEGRGPSTAPKSAGAHKATKPGPLAMDAGTRRGRTPGL